MRMLAAEPYDLVAVDPAISPGGFALLKHVKDNYRWTATLVATHNQDPQFLRQAVKCRIDGLLFRPATPHEFIEQALLLAKAVTRAAVASRSACWRSAPIPTTSRSAAAARWPSTTPRTTSCTS